MYPKEYTYYVSRVSNNSIIHHDNIITTGTMALVSLGSALFTINSTFGFLNGPMSWDSSRVSAAIPSGMCEPYTIF